MLLLLLLIAFIYSAILRSRADSLRSHVILHEWIVFIARFWISTEVVYLQRWHGWCHKNLLPERVSLGAFCVPCHFMQSRIRKMYACLAVTCHLRFWQNDRGLLRATAVTRGWNGYRNKSQHRKSTLEKKILPPLQQGFEPATFQSRVRRSNHWAIPAIPALVSKESLHADLFNAINCCSCIMTWCVLSVKVEICHSFFFFFFFPFFSLW